MIMNSKSTQEFINLAIVAEQAERYEDMVRFIKEAFKSITEAKPQNYRSFKNQEIKLLSTAYKCKISCRRTAWRALEILQSKEANIKNRSSAIIQFYKENIEKEIRQIGQEVISTLNSLLVSEKSTCQSRVEFYKMKGDFHRYLCQIAKDSQELKKLQKDCQSSYKKGIEELKSEAMKEPIKSYDPRRLAIYLNLSVFYYEIVLLLPKAIEICEEGFNCALEDISDLEEAKYIDSVTIMQLMHDNITAWRNEKDKKLNSK